MLIGILIGLISGLVASAIIQTNVLAAFTKENFKPSHNTQSDAIIADIKEVVRTWFKCNDDLTHRECDILNSIVKIYKR